MRSALALPALLLALSLGHVSISQSVVNGSAGKTYRAKAVMLLESSSAHTYGGNQEIYVADLKLAGQKEPQLAKIVDRYPGYGLHIDRSILALSRPLRVHVTRDAACDAPADRIALPSNKQGEFAPEVRQKLQEHGSEVLPCFLLDHDTARLTGHRE